MFDLKDYWGRDPDLVVRDPDHGQTKGHIATRLILVVVIVGFQIRVLDFGFRFSGFRVLD